MALDAEFVSCVIGKKLNGKDKCKNEAATVSIVNYKYETILNEKIYHKKGTFKSPTWLTGIKSGDLDDGIPLNKVQDLVMDKLERKLVIMVNHWADIQALDLVEKYRKLDIFDLHSAYKTWNYDTEKEEPISLKRIYKGSFNKIIQQGIHTSLDDAKHTMEIFMNAYTKNIKVNSFYRASNENDCLNAELFL